MFMKIFIKKNLQKSTYFIVIGVLLNLAYAFYASDFFPYGRMYLSCFFILLFSIYFIENSYITTFFIIMVASLSLSNTLGKVTLIA